MSEKPLNLLSLDEAGFDALYAGRIAPIFAAREGERRAALRQFIWRMIAAVAVAVVVGWLVGGGDVWDGLIWGGFTLAAGSYVAYLPLEAVARRTKSESLDAIAKAIGTVYLPAAFATSEIERFRTVSLLPGAERDTFEDLFEGAYRGCAYRFFDAHLENKVRSRNSSRWVTVFRGQVIRIAFPKRFHGLTVVRRDAGLFNAVHRWMTTLQRVGLGDSRLERAFEVYSNDQVEARDLIHPVFMERLLALEQRLHGAKLRCAFQDGDLLIAIEGDNRFEIGSMFEPLNDPARMRSVIDDIAEILRIVDAVLTAEEGALPAETKTGPSPGPSTS